MSLNEPESWVNSCLCSWGSIFSLLVESWSRLSACQVLCMALYHISHRCVGFIGWMPVYLCLHLDALSLVHLGVFESQREWNKQRQEWLWVERYNKDIASLSFVLLVTYLCLPVQGSSGTPVWWTKLINSCRQGSKGRKYAFNLKLASFSFNQYRMPRLSKLYQKHKRTSSGH